MKPFWRNVARAVLALVLVGVAWALLIGPKEPHLLFTLERRPGFLPAVFEFLIRAGGRPSVFFNSNVEDVAFSPDGKQLATVSNDGKEGRLKVWDAANGQNRLTVGGTNLHFVCHSVSFSADGKQLIAPDWNVVKFWDADSGKLMQSMPMQEGVGYAHVGSGGRQLATVNVRQKTVSIWDVVTGKESHSWTYIGALPPDQRVVSFATSSRWVAFVGSDFHEIKLCDSESGQVMHTLKADRLPVCLDFNARGTRLFGLFNVGRGEGEVRIWDVTTGAAISHGLNGTVDYCVSAALSPDGSRIALGSVRGRVTVRDVATGDLLFTLEGPTDSARCLRFGPDGTRLAAAANGGLQVKVWDVTSSAAPK